MSEEWSLTPPSNQSDSSSEWSLTPPEQSATSDSPIPQPPIGERISSAFKQTGDIAMQSLSNIGSDSAGGGMFNITQGQTIPDAIKKAVLDKVIPSNDLISSSAKNALIAGTNPANILLAMEPAESINAALKRNINLGGDKALTQVAKDSMKALTAAQEAFKSSYNDLFESVGHKIIPQAEREALITTAANSIEQTAPNSAANNFLENKFPEVLNQEGLNIKDLHAMKGQIFKSAKSMIGVEKNAMMNVYNTINKVLSSDNLAGKTYAALTSEQHAFFNDEANYVKKLILDPVNKNKVTNAKLNPSGFLGAKTPIKLADNYRDAFAKLSSRSTSEVNVLKELEAVRRGTILKRAILTGAGALAHPDIRRAIITSAKIATGN